MNRSAASRGVSLGQLDGDIELRESAFVGLRRKSERAILGVAVVAVCGATVVITTGGVASQPSVFAAVLVANIATYFLAAVLWRRGRPYSAVGALLLVEGLLQASASLVGSPVPLVYLLGILGGWAAALLVTWILLAFPGANLRGKSWIVMGVACATFLFGELPLLLLSPTVHGLAAIGRCTTACPANPALVSDAPNLAQSFDRVEAVLQATWATGLLVFLSVSFMRASHPRRRLLLPVFAASVPFLIAFAANAVVFDLGGVAPSDASRAIFAATRIMAPLGFIAGLLFARAYAGEALTFMSRKLVGRPSVAAVEQLVRRVLDDPHARLVFWLPRSEQFVDRHGAGVVLDPTLEGVTWRAFGDREPRVLSVVHDVALSDDPELVEAVGAGSLLALENRRLEHDLIDSVDALRASQRRLVGAASAERRKIERDLHDGVQQKLVALRIQLELLRDLAAENGLGNRLDGLASDFDDVIDELRSTAHGIYPPLLSDEGLEPALREVARRASGALSVDLEDVGRLTEDREIAIYYCCVEALQNVAKHAGDDAVASLRLWREPKAVRFCVHDDGVGFVSSPGTKGAGLTNMTDRIGAVGGTLSVRSSPGEGTTVLGGVAIEASERIGDVVGI